MSILAPAVNEFTPQQNAANAIREITIQTYAHLCSTQKRGVALVWASRDGLTPQQVCDALGTDATKVFIVHGLLTQLLVTLAAIDGITPNISLPTNAFTFNSDGTITVLETPYVP